jgi:dsDNA-specific endonuclease/ATPase MutS2
MAFIPGDSVHVAALGKAIVREVRPRGHYLVELKGRTMIVAEIQMSAVVESKRGRRAPAALVPPPPDLDFAGGTNASSSIDLHGMTTDEAVAALDEFLNEAILSSVAEVRVIHGRSGGRLKGAVHARLRQLPSIRGFRIDPANPGVTIVTL